LTAAETTAPRITFNLRRSVLGARATLAVVKEWSRANQAGKSLFAHISRSGNVPAFGERGDNGAHPATNGEFIRT